MAIIKSRENESIELTLRRFKRAVEKEGIIMEVRRREYFEKPTWKRKRKAAAAKKRHAKRLLREMPQRRGARVEKREPRFSHQRQSA